MIFMFSLFMIMLKDYLFCFPEKLVFISSLFFVLKYEPLYFFVGWLGVLYVFNIPSAEGFNDFR